MVIFSGEAKIVKVSDSNDKYLFDTFEGFNEEESEKECRGCYNIFSIYW